MRRIELLLACVLAAAASVNAADLPDPQSPGATLVISYCSQCHGLPNAASHSAQEWPSVVARMQNWRITKGFGEIPPKDVAPLTDYLKRHAGR